jgi:hypothetical protein
VGILSLYLTDLITESRNSSHHEDCEKKILELMAHAARQDEILKAQAIQISHLTEQHSRENKQTDNTQQQAIEVQPRSTENERADPTVMFTELKARINKAIHASMCSQDGADTKQSTQSLVKRQTASLHSMSETPVSVKNISSPTTDSSGGSLSPKQTAMVTNITADSKYSTKSVKISPQEESSSDSAPETLNNKTGATSMYGLIEQELHTSDKTKSPQGSKDSGLDSPMRFSIYPIRKSNAFKGLPSVKTTSDMNGSKDRVDTLAEVTGSEDEGETISDEATVDETETETDIGSEHAVTTVHR